MLKERRQTWKSTFSIIPLRYSSNTRQKLTWGVRSQENDYPWQEEGVFFSTKWIYQISYYKYTFELPLQFIKIIIMALQIEKLTTK